MENDLGAMLESVLSNPAQMEMIANMAQNLLGSDVKPTEAGDGTRDESHSQNASHEGIGSILTLLGKSFGGNRPKSRSTQLLLAMKPYMRPEKQEKLDRAIKIAEIVHIAGFVMKEYGGDFFGSL